jgi:hypothetical protein
MSCQEVLLGSQVIAAFRAKEGQVGGNDIYAEQSQRFPGAAPNTGSRPSAQCLWSNESPRTELLVWIRRERCP